MIKTLKSPAVPREVAGIDRQPKTKLFSRCSYINAKCITYYSICKKACNLLILQALKTIRFIICQSSHYYFLPPEPLPDPEPDELFSAFEESPEFVEPVPALFAPAPVLFCPELSAPDWLPADGF